MDHATKRPYATGRCDACGTDGPLHLKWHELVCERCLRQREAADVRIAAPVSDPADRSPYRPDEPPVRRAPRRCEAANDAVAEARIDDAVHRPFWSHQPREAAACKGRAA